MEDAERGTQLTMWHLLGSTAVALASGLRSPEAVEIGRGGATAHDLGQSAPGQEERAAGVGTPHAGHEAAKGRLTIGAAKYGNTLVVKRRE